jgi:hypothetical protein
MAKNTHAQEAATGTPDSYTRDEAVELSIPADPEGSEMSTVEGGAPSVTEDGEDSSESTGQSQNDDVKLSNSPRAPVHTTESPSKETKPADSGADSADGSSPKTEEKSAKTPAKKTAPKKRPPAGAEDHEFDV